MQKVKLNLIPQGVPPVVYASLYDVHREFNFEIFDGITDYVIPKNAIVTIFGTKPDNKSFAYNSKDQSNVISFSDSIVTVNSTQQMTAIPGVTNCEIRIAQDANVLGTLNFRLYVEKSTFPTDPWESHSDLQAYQTAINATEHYATAAYNSAQDAASSASEADKAYQKTVSAYNDTVEEHNNAVKEITQLTSDSKTALNKIVSDGKTDIQTLINNFNSGNYYTEDITINSRDWSGTKPPYSYTIPNVSNDMAVFLDIAEPGTTEDQMEAINAAGIYGSKGNVIYATGDKPDIAIPLRLIYLKGGN